MTLQHTSQIVNHDDVEKQIEVALNSSDHQEVLKGLEIAKQFYSAAARSMSCALPNSLNGVSTQSSEYHYASSMNSYQSWEFVA